MDTWTKAALKTFLLPGSVLLMLAAGLLHSGLLPLSGSAIDFYYYSVFATGLLLAWRFHSSRVMFILITLLLAHRALEYFAGGRIALTGPGRIAFCAVAVLLPLNFAISSFTQEGGFNLPATAPRLGLLFLESVFVAVVCRPDDLKGPWFLRGMLVKIRWLQWVRIPQIAIIVLLLVLAVLGVRFLLYRKMLEGGLFWSLAAVAAGMQFGGVGRLGSAYFATAGLVLAASIVENSYILAYHDELTTLPSRRAFHGSLLGLEPPYAIAMVDIDHFKTFNDTFGHDAGDEVLRMVAMRLAEVTGGGKAYRIGGEEFTIVFPGKSAQEAFAHLESLRQRIAESTFRLRRTPERRTASRGPDRRQTARRRSPRRYAASSDGIFVTVSMGVAESGKRNGAVEEIIQIADQALYRAKRGGRNRVEMAGRTRSARSKRNIA